MQINIVRVSPIIILYDNCSVIVIVHVASAVKYFINFINNFIKKKTTYVQNIDYFNIYKLYIKTIIIYELTSCL